MICKCTELCQLLAGCTQQRWVLLHLGKLFLLPSEQTIVSWNNAADESLSKENRTLTSWVLKSHSGANTLPQ